ncbi:hypothetical protein WJX73_010301 [Symbiochloris irregularis]|uniref:Protein kinase domain-containing protein n=1 Tax=Symbiochloris irregularis TaxID=706552 RepID=A0AAW1P5N9_9CHLO
MAQPSPVQAGVKQLTWKFFASSCNAYQLDVIVKPLSHSATRLLKVSGEGGMVEIRVNGIRLLASKQHAIWSQLPFRAYKTSLEVQEPGLGKICNCQITIRAELTKDDVLQGVASVNDRALPAPAYKKGMGPSIPPLLQLEPVSRSNAASSRQESELGQLLGDKPMGWTSLHSVIDLQRNGRYNSGMGANGRARRTRSMHSDGSAGVMDTQPLRANRASNDLDAAPPPQLLQTTNSMHMLQTGNSDIGAPLQRSMSTTSSASHPRAAPSNNRVAQAETRALQAAAQRSAVQSNVRKREAASQAGGGPHSVASASAGAMSIGPQSVYSRRLAQADPGEDRPGDGMRKRSDDTTSEAGTTNSHMQATPRSSRPSEVMLNDLENGGGNHMHPNEDLRAADSQQAAPKMTANGTAGTRAPSRSAAAASAAAAAAAVAASDPFSQARDRDRAAAAAAAAAASDPFSQAREKDRAAARERARAASARNIVAVPVPAQNGLEQQAGSPTTPDQDSREMLRARTPTTGEDGAQQEPPSPHSTRVWDTQQRNNAKKAAVLMNHLPADPLQQMSSQATEVRAARHAQQQGNAGGALMTGSSSGGSEEEPEGTAAMDATEDESLNQQGPPSTISNRSNGRARNWFISREEVQIARSPQGKKMRIGEGGSGTVYKAYMHGCDEVAVKVVRAAHPAPDEAVAFQREVGMLRSLRHRNIVQFYGACLQPDCFFIVTELMHGGDMYSMLKRAPELLAWNKLGKRIALDVALGLNYLHSRRPTLLHRDLKSPNVLLTKEGSAKIADVGMMRSQVSQSTTAQVAWTPLWAAPEVFRQERATVKADIWSYGIVLWELATLQNVADFPPLGMSVQVQGSITLKLPPVCPPVAARIFYETTKLQPSARPSAMEIVKWLREG